MASSASSASAPCTSTPPSSPRGSAAASSGSESAGNLVLLRTLEVRPRRLRRALLEPAVPGQPSRLRLRACGALRGGLRSSLASTRSRSLGWGPPSW
eukprot:9335429-Alexandrium_andersonii.AAC.1